MTVGAEAWLSTPGALAAAYADWHWDLAWQCEGHSVVYRLSREGELKLYLKLAPANEYPALPDEAARLRWVAYRDVRLSALRESPSAFGSTVEAEQSRSDAAWEERVSSRADAPSDLPLVIEDGERFVGLAWGRINPAEPDTAHLYQMWVAPERRGAGYGATMLGSIIGWARESGARRLVLQVTCGNEAAERLYERAGFIVAGSPGPLRPGSDLLSRTMQLDF